MTILRVGALDGIFLVGFTLDFSRFSLCLGLVLGFAFLLQEVFLFCQRTLT